MLPSFGFEGGIWDLIVLVHCNGLSFYFDDLFFVQGHRDSAVGVLLLRRFFVVQTIEYSSVCILLFCLVFFFVCYQF